MSDDYVSTELEPTAGNGKGRGDVASLDAFKNTPGANSSPAGGGGNKGDGAKKRGRPSHASKTAKAGAGADSKKNAASSVPPIFDMDSEEERRDFEVLLTEILVATTEETAAYRFELLKRVHPEDVARAQADKALLSPLEKKYFGLLAVRIYTKYVGNNFGYTDEMMAGVLAIRYFLRNREPARLAKEVLAAHGPKSDNKRPGPQRSAGVDPGNNGHGEINVRSTADSSPPR